jgi:diketogulonate reductase-like aldo/keto reductase
MKNIILNNGVTMPQIGLGLWQVKDSKELELAVKAALDAGYRHFDTAQVYENEELLGSALWKLGVRRKDVFIASKLQVENMMLRYIEPTFQKTLDNLQTEYVDLFLMHFPATEKRHSAWRIGMQEIYRSGRAKAIGVSNYTIRHLEELKEWGVMPAVNQVELHVYLQQPELLEYCREHGIVVEAYSPLAHGYGMGNEVLKVIAEKHGKSTAQIMIRWCIEVGTVPLPKSVNPERIKENIDVFDFSLDQEDMQKIASLDQNLRTCWDPTNTP